MRFAEGSPHNWETMDVLALREQTREEHEATEAGLPLGGKDMTREEYRRVLQAMFPVVRGWELWAERNAPAELLPLLLARQRSPLLGRDLRLLSAGAAETGEGLPGGVFDPLPQAEEPGELTAEAAREARFLGALYVMEGSTLGGQYVARQAEEVLGLSPGEGSAYFRGFGERTGSMWREVKAVLAGAPEEWLGETVAAAKAMFGIFGAGVRAGLLAAETSESRA